MWPNPQQTVDLVTFTEEILNGELHFFVCSASYVAWLNLTMSSLRKMVTLTLKTLKHLFQDFWHVFDYFVD